MYFVNDEPDWSTVSFLERWFLVFRFHQHEKFLCLEFLSADDIRFISWFLPKFLIFLLRLATLTGINSITNLYVILMFAVKHIGASGECERK